MEQPVRLPTEMLHRMYAKVCYLEYPLAKKYAQIPLGVGYD